MMALWTVLGILQVLTFWPLSFGGVTALILVNWIAGAAMLVLDRRTMAISSCLRQVLEHRVARTAVQLHLGLLAWSIYLFGYRATLLLLGVAATAVFLAALLRRESLLRESLVGTALLGWVALLLLGVAELSLRLPALAARFGTPRELAAWEERYDGIWRSNILGFRSPYEDTRRRAGVPRIVALGDSFTWGDKIAAADSTWPARLERILERELPAGEVEVVNMAQRGYTLANEAELLRRIGWQFSPDLVLVQFYVNDALPSGPNLQRESSNWLFPHHSLLPGFAYDGAIGSSAAMAVLDGAFNRVLSRFVSDLSPSRWATVYEDGTETWRQLEAALYEMGDSARVRDVPIYLVLFPDFRAGSWTTADYPFREIHEKVAKNGSDAGFRLIDLVPEFAAAGRDWSSWWATPYDAHPSSAAHRLAAETIARDLLANGGLESIEAGDQPPVGEPRSGEHRDGL